ncbi:MAG: lipid-A-disaccharide synthase [Muribaculaceae bacterium]|nr:lipid-A-disaccharide synthase [Muribaculaceae bacterium]
MKYMIVAGEASGDLHASQVIQRLRELDKEAEFRFFGGDLMARVARKNPDVHYSELNVMGFSSVIRRLPKIMRHLRHAVSILKDFRPDVLLLVDYPGFNMRLARIASKMGIRVDYYISPKVWAWKEYRVRSIRRYVNHLYTILPFETPFYRERGFEVEYVGNPSVAEIDYALGHLPPKKHFVERQGISDERPIIALLPGSRISEIRSNLPVMIEAARRYPEYQYVVAAAPSVSEKFYRQIAQDQGLPLVFGSTHTLLKYSRAALVTSGTATLETALIGTPQIVCYRSNGSRLTYNIMKRLLKVKYVALPNLIVGNGIVPELLLHQCTPERIRCELTSILENSPQRAWQLGGYKNMRRRLGTSNAANTVAEKIISHFSD